ncbi:MAG TPA: anthranilate phosphoribosyltransferase, partial [Gammaproteobacteria bacterium]|nr:anthranilate phosphoribosyltransferase [Gammaproteobacteria bacterium]
MSDEQIMRAAIQKVATGPEYSKDLSLDEARDAMRVVLSGRADPVQAGVLLIALRMKRETLDEFTGALQALREVTLEATAEVDE